MGKTRFAATFPGAAFVSCPGNEALSLAGVQGAQDLTIYQASEWEDICAGLLGLSQSKKPEVQTVILDTLTFAFELTVEKVKSEQTGPSANVVHQGTWTEANRRCLELLDNVSRHCYTTGKNFVILCHSRRLNLGDEKNPNWYTTFALGDSLRDKVSGRYNSIFHLRLIGANKRELIMKSTPGYDVGSRYDFQKNLVDPTGQSLMETIQEYKQKVEANG